MSTMGNMSNEIDSAEYYGEDNGVTTTTMSAGAENPSVEVPKLWIIAPVVVGCLALIGIAVFCIIKKWNVLRPYLPSVLHPCRTRAGYTAPKPADLEAAAEKDVKEIQKETQ